MDKKNTYFLTIIGKCWNPINFFVQNNTTRLPTVSLQLFIEEITKKTVEELAIEKVFKPIGMIKTGYIRHERLDDNLL